MIRKVIDGLLVETPASTALVAPCTGTVFGTPGKRVAAAAATG